MHELKSWPEFFQATMDGKKTFDLRRNDRSFRVGDSVLLREWEPSERKYSGRALRLDIVYILEGVGVGAIEPYHGLLRGYCVLGLKLLDQL